MPITFTYEKKDEHGNKYCVDEDGNRVEEENEEYRYLNKDYVDYVNSLTEEQLAQQRADGEARVAARKAEQIRAATPFLLNLLNKPVTVRERKPLWGHYWAEREFCVLVGDTGVGKSLMAIRVAKQLAMQNATPPLNPLPLKGGEIALDVSSPLQGGDVGPDSYRDKTEGVSWRELVTPSERNPNPQQVLKQVQDDVPKKVLFVDFELDEEEFWLRYGEPTGTENFYWAGFNASALLPKDIDGRIDWLLNGLENHIKDIGCTVLVIDQVDRLQIPISRRMEFLAKLKLLARKYELSTLLTLNTRARNFSKEVGMQHIYNSRLYVPLADSIVAMAADYYDETCRYIKPLKLRNRALNLRAELECFSVYEGEETEGENNYQKLHLSFTAIRAEEDLMKKSKARIREEKIMTAEALRSDGMTYEYIADTMLLPISTIKRWVSCVPVKPFADGSSPLHAPKVSAAWGNEAAPADGAGLALGIEAAAPNRVRAIADSPARTE